jgi:hypothetical protein
MKRQCEEVREKEPFLDCERRKNEIVLLNKYYAVYPSYRVVHKSYIFSCKIWKISGTLV